MSVPSVFKSSLAYAAPVFFLFVAMPVSFAAVSASFTAGIVIGTPERHQTSIAKFRYTWGAAEVSATLAGYRNPARLSRADGIYWFLVFDQGSDLKIGISARNGNLVARIRNAGSQQIRAGTHFKQGEEP